MIYVDNAATTFPKPDGVYEQTFRFLKESGGNPGRGGHYFANASRQVVEESRQRIARFLGIRDPKRVIFTANCTDSINMVLKGYLKPGSHVVASNLDHNAVSRPLETLRRSGIIELTRIRFDSEGFALPAWFEGALRHNTILIVLCHASNVLGTVQDLKAIAKLSKANGIPLLVDAAQTAGRIAIDADEAPMFVACSAHKALFGLPGLGILTLPENSELQPSREGGTGTSSESVIHPQQLPERLEAGTPNVPAIASLKYGLDFIEREGMDRIHEKEMQLLSQLHSQLNDDPRFEFYSGPDYGPHVAVAALNIKGVPPEEAAAILDQSFGIAVRAGLHCAAVLHQQLGTIPGGCLRISPGFFNSEEDINQTAKALKQIAEKY
jgi:cysteine desulfurase / selenocysteine lyase